MKNTAGEKLQKLLNRFIEYRDTQVKKLDENPNLTIGDVTTVNITMVNGGVQANVIPCEIKLVVDCRLALDIDHVEFEKMFKGWCSEAGDGIEYCYGQKQPKVPATKVDDSNQYWVAFKKALDDL